MWSFIVLIWLALIVGIIWAYKRKTNDRALQGAERLEALLSELKQRPRPAAELPPEIAARSSAAINPRLPAARAIRKRLLSDRGRLLYYIFRAGLPEHALFVNLRLGDLIAFDAKGPIGGSGPDADVLNQKLDLVICSKDLQTLAVAVIGDTKGGGAQTPAAQHLASVGIRLIRVDPTRPPDRSEISNLVYGDKGDGTVSR